jgi:hypothetical protein
MCGMCLSLGQVGFRVSASLGVTWWRNGRPGLFEALASLSIATVETVKLTGRDCFGVVFCLKRYLVRHFAY